MVGNQQHQLSNKDFTDPFYAGQMVGMLTMLTMIEKNNGITDDVLQHIKYVTATNAEAYFEAPAEDILAKIDDIVKEVEQL